MSEREIIEGLMLYLKDESIDVMRLVKRIGLKDYKIFDEAMQAAFELLNLENK